MKGKNVRRGKKKKEILRAPGAGATGEGNVIYIQIPIFRDNNTSDCG